MLTFLVSIAIHAQDLISYNQAGYLPAQEKRAVYQSDDDKSSTSWTIKNSSNVTVENGILGISA